MPGEMMRGEKGGEFSNPRRCVGVGVVQRARFRDERGRPEWWETVEIESDLERKAASWFWAFQKGSKGWGNEFRECLRGFVLELNLAGSAKNISLTNPRIHSRNRVY